MSHDPQMLNFFRGGPLDGYAYETSTIIETPQHNAGAIPITEYRWTPEVITSAITGKRARVWLHKLLDAGEPAAMEDEEEPQVTDKGEEKMDLLETRKSLGLSRAALAKESGVSQAKIYRIENGGPRTTDEERDQLAGHLTRLQSEAPEVAEDPS